MNYIINIKTRDLITSAIIIIATENFMEKKVKKFIKDFKKAKEEVAEHKCELEDDYIYCPCCGKKIKDEDS